MCVVSSFTFDNERTNDDRRRMNDISKGLLEVKKLLTIDSEL